MYFWLCSTSDIQSCIDFLEEESEQSCEPGPLYISDTVTTASEAKERDGSLRASSCQVKTSPSPNGAVSKTSYPARGNSTCPTCFKGFPLEEIEAHADLCVDIWVDPTGELESDREQEFIGTEELSCDEHASDEQGTCAENDVEFSHKLKDAVNKLQENIDFSKKLKHHWRMSNRNSPIPSYRAQNYKNPCRNIVAIC